MTTTDQTQAGQTQAGQTQTGQTGSGAAGAATVGAQYVDKARAFAKARPGATAALAGVVGLAILNTLRGRR